MAQVVPIALAALQVLGGISQAAKANKARKEADTEAKKLQQNKPVKTTSGYDTAAVDLAKSELANGMSAEAKQAYQDNSDRATSASINASVKSGGTLNNIGEIYGAGEQGRQNLAIIQDQLRLSQIQNLLRTYDKGASEEEKNWLANQYGPYKDQLQAIGQQKQAAANAAQSGTDTALAGVTNALGSINDNKLGNSLNPPKSNISSNAITPYSNNGFSGTTGDSTSPASILSNNISTIQPQPAYSNTLQPRIPGTNQPGPVQNYLQPVKTNNDWGDFWQTYNLNL